MPVATWNAPGDRLFEAGVDQGMLYPMIGVGVPWNGLVNITQNPVNAEPAAVYIDGELWRRDSKPTDYQATLQAYYYPDEFLPCDGMYLEDGIIFDGQIRKEFGLSYRTQVGNDIEGTEFGEKIHVVYQALAVPSARAYASQSATVTPGLLSWTLHTRPVYAAGYRPTAHLIVDSTKATTASLTALKKVLYGGPLSSEHPRLPTLTEVITIISGDAPVQTTHPALTLYPSVTLIPR